jgi:hypothetical protein
MSQASRRRDAQLSRVARVLYGAAQLRPVVVPSPPLVQLVVGQDPSTSADRDQVAPAVVTRVWPSA